MRPLACLAILVSLVINCSPSLAALPQVVSVGECAVLADMALVARAGAIERVRIESIRAMLPHIYRLQDERIRELTEWILLLAYRGRGSAQVFASALGQACIARGGDLSEFFGGMAI